MGVWDDHLEVEDISVRFRITDPFGGSCASVAVTVTGTIEIEGEVCDLAGAAPPGFDLSFSYASVLVQKRGADYVLQLGTAVDGVGLFAFEAGKVGTQWGFSACLDLGATRLSRLPGLAALKPIEDLVKLDKLLLVISTHDNPSFQFPDLAHFNNPNLGAKNLALPATARGVSKGLMAFAEWKLDANDRQQAMLMKLLGLGGTQAATLAIGQDPANEAKLFFSERGKLAGQPFDYQLGVMLTRGQPSMFLKGDLTFDIHGQPQTFDTTMACVPTGAFFSATMKGSAPVDCKLFKLSNLALQIGVNWGGVPSLGIAATIDVNRFQSQVAIFFDSTDPSRSLVAGSISNLTLKDVADTLLGAALPSAIDEVLSKASLKGTHRFLIPGDLADELDSRDIAEIAAAFGSAGKIQIPSASEQVVLCVNEPGQSWHLTDLTMMRHYALKKSGNAIEVSVEPQFYFAPQATFIGSISFPQGYYVNAAIDVFGFKAQATVDIRANKGVAVDAQMDKIVLGNEGVFCVCAADGKAGPKVSVSTFAQPDHPTPEFRQPHFYVSGRAKLLGIEAVAFANVSTEGIALELKGQLAPGVTFDLDAQFGGSELVVDGDFEVGIGTLDLGELGKIKVDTNVEGSLGVRVSGQKVEAAVEASFEFLGNHVQIGRFVLDGSPDALAKVGKTMEKKVEAELREIFSDVGRWTSAVGSGVVDGVEDTEKVLKNVYKKSDKEAKAIAKDVGKGAKSAEKAVSKEAEKFGKKLKKIF